MKVVIDISDNYYNTIKENEYGIYEGRLYNIIRKGTPLPKGHGDLIDRNKIEYLKAIHDAKYGHITWSDAVARIKYSAPTIIEADIPTMYYPQVEGITPTVVNDGSDMLSAEEIDNLLQALAERESEE